MTVADLVAVLPPYRLLQPAQLGELELNLPARFPEPEPRATELLQRGWLSRAHADRTLQGPAEQLRLATTPCRCGRGFNHSSFSGVMDGSRMRLPVAWPHGPQVGARAYPDELGTRGPDSGDRRPLWYPCTWS